ncbi:protein jag [bacterium]|nr:protein jag [bacterium]
MAESIQEAKTVDAAIEAAIKELGCSKESAQIEIIQEPTKGIFGLAKMAKVRVIYNDTTEKRDSDFPEVDQETLREATSQSQDILKKVLTLMGISNAKIKASEVENSVYLDIHCDAEGLLIGRHGQTLSSLQYLINRMVHNHATHRARVVVDVGGYRIRHKVILEKMAKRIGQKVAETKEEEELQAMSPYDRRIIHLYMKENPEVVTYSTGEGNYRRVVIAPRKNEAASE